MLGEEHRGLAGGVAAADDQHRVAGAHLRLRLGGGVVDAEALVALELGEVELSVLGAGGDDHRPAVDDRPVGQLDRVVAVVGRQADRERRHHHARAEPPRLERRALGELAPGDPGREPEVVLDPRRRARLAAERDLVDHLRVEALRGAVHGRRQAGGTGADDHEIAHRRRGPARAEPQQLRDLGVARVAQDALAADHDRRLGGGDAERPQQPVGLLVAPRGPATGTACGCGRGTRAAGACTASSASRRASPRRRCRSGSSGARGTRAG